MISIGTPYLRDAGLPMLTIAFLSPVAVACFRYGVPIEIIVFGLLISGYKLPQYLRRCRRGNQDNHRDKAEPAEASRDSSSKERDESSNTKSGKEATGLASWRSKLSWRKAAKSGGKESDEGSWR